MIYIYIIYQHLQSDLVLCSIIIGGLGPYEYQKQNKVTYREYQRILAISKGYLNISIYAASNPTSPFHTQSSLALAEQEIVVTRSGVQGEPGGGSWWFNISNLEHPGTLAYNTLLHPALQQSKPSHTYKAGVALQNLPTHQIWMGNHAHRFHLSHLGG